MTDSFKLGTCVPKIIHLDGSTSNGSTKRLKKYYFALHLEKKFGEKNELMLTS